MNFIISIRVISKNFRFNFFKIIFSETRFLDFLEFETSFLFTKDVRNIGLFPFLAF